MKVLELFAGTRSISKAFERRGHQTWSVEWDRSFDGISLYMDINELAVDKIVDMCRGVPDVIWASPDCSTFSIAAISHHRKKDPATGNLRPVSEYAKQCDMVDRHVLALIRQLQPKLWFIENPVGGMRKMYWMQGLPRYSVTYCFSKDTVFVTNEGHKTFEQMRNQTTVVLNKDCEWERAVVRSYGVQKLYKLTLSRAKKKKEVFVTKNHIWYATTKGNKNNYKKMETIELQKGMFLPYSIPQKEEYSIVPEFVARGFVFGDGHFLKKRPQIGSFSQFVDEKIEMLKYFDGFGGKRWRDDNGNNQIIKLCGLPLCWKTEIPSITEDKSAIFSWIAGYIAADGSCSSSNGQLTISSCNKENLQRLRELAEHIGIGTYGITEFWRYGYGKEKTPIYTLTFFRGDVPLNMIVRKKHLEAFEKSGNVKHQPRRWCVVSVEETDRFEEVFCCETEKTHTFTLEDGVVTHNCQYGDKRRKPTDIWTNHPDPQFLPMCRNGDPCHEAAPRGSKTGTQGLKGARERAVIPRLLCEHIVDICEWEVEWDGKG